MRRRNTVPRVTGVHAMQPAGDSRASTRPLRHSSSPAGETELVRSSGKDGSAAQYLLLRVLRGREQPQASFIHGNGRKGQYAAFDTVALQPIRQRNRHCLGAENDRDNPALTAAGRDLTLERM